MPLLDLVENKVNDESGRLTDVVGFQPAIDAALKTYSIHNPKRLVRDQIGADSHELDLPAEWVAEFSRIEQVEFPIGNIPETIIGIDARDLYQSPTGLKLRLYYEQPAVSESVRISFTLPRLEADVPQQDLDAVADLAAANCCEILATLFSQDSDSTIGADVVNHQSKSSRYGRRAKRLRELYLNHVGVDDETTPAAASTVAPPPDRGRTRLTH